MIHRILVFWLLFAGFLVLGHYNNGRLRAWSDVLHAMLASGLLVAGGTVAAALFLWFCGYNLFKR